MRSNNKKIEFETQDAIISSLSQTLSVKYVFQPIYDSCKNIAFYEILGRVKDGKDSQQKAIYPEIAEKFTKLLLFYSNNIIGNNFLGESKISINLSSSEINDETISFMMYLFVKSKKAHRVIVEVTEDVFIDKYNAELLQKLKKYNFCIALDDFCSEKSVREIICDYDFIDIVKFDGVFMNKIGSKGENIALIDGLKHLNSFAKSLGKQTVIEHIENEMLFSIAKNSGADFFQGFYLGRPMPLEHYDGGKYDEAING